MKRLISVRNGDAGQGYVALNIETLADPIILGPLLQRFARRYPGANQAAVASQWSMNYLSVMLPSFLVPALITQQAIDLEQSEVIFLHDEDASPMALAFTSQARSLSPAQWPEYCERLFAGHLEAIMASLSTTGGIAPKVLWNNLVVAWDELFRRLDVHLPSRRFLDIEGAHRWLEMVRGGRLSLRPLQRRVDSPAPELSAQLPLRTHCCLHYQLHAPVEGEFPVWCESCPKLHCRPAEEQVRYLYQLQEESESA